jgi:aryl-alcohol dehydrogenase-like predicted oxidoreductase
MDVRPIGSSGVTVSAIGLGGYQLGPEPGEIPDIDRGVDVIQAALDHGINTGAWEETDFYRKLADPEWETRCDSFVGRLRAVADRLGVTVAQLAIAWVLHQPGITAAIVGSRDGRHMAENAGAADVRLEASMDALERLIPLGPNVAP